MSDLTDCIPAVMKDQILVEFAGNTGKPPYSQIMSIARKWNISPQCVRDLYMEADQVDFAKIRQSTALKGSLLQHKVLDGLSDDLQDPLKLLEIPPEKKATMAKQLGDMALNALNGGVQVTQTNISIGDVITLIQKRDERKYVSIREKLNKEGDPEKF